MKYIRKTKYGISNPCETTKITNKRPIINYDFRSFLIYLTVTNAVFNPGTLTATIDSPLFFASLIFALPLYT